MSKTTKALLGALLLAATAVAGAFGISTPEPPTSGLGDCECPPATTNAPDAG